MRYKKEYREKNNKTKKTKFVWLVSILTVCMILFGVGAAYAYPYIQDVVIPKKQLARAIEKECTNLVSGVDAKLTELQQEKTDHGVRYAGTFTLNHTNVNQRNLMDELKVDTIAFDMDVQTHAETIRGELNLQSGAQGQSEFKVLVHADSVGIVIQAPQLLEESIVLKYSDTGYESELTRAWSVFVSALGNAQIHNMDQYETSIQAAVKDIVSGLKVLLENTKITTSEHLTVDGVNGSEKATVLTLALTPDAIYKGIETTVNHAYADQELNSYLTLVATYTGMAKNEILEHTRSLTERLKDIPMVICISKDDRILSVDLKLDQPELGINMELIAGSIENERITDHTTYELFVHNVEGITNLWNQYVPELTLNECSGRMILSRTASILTLHELQAAGKVRLDVNQTVKEATVDLNFSGQCNREESAVKTKQELETGKNKLMKQTFDLYHFNQNHQDKVTTQLDQNSHVLRNLISDSWYESMME